MKQVPLAFILMTRWTKDDYIVVLQALKDAMAGPPAVEWFMLDFEAGKFINFLVPRYSMYSFKI